MTAPDPLDPAAAKGERVKLMPTRRAALEFVAAGKLQYSISIGTWEPTEGYRHPAFDWLDEHGLISPDYDAEPRGRVLRVVDVHVTEAGKVVLDA